MDFRSFLLAGAVLAGGIAPALAEPRSDALATPALRAEVTVTGDVVRIGDVIDNAGQAADIAIYRAPDLGTVGTLSAAQVIATLRNHHVIGVNTRNIREITIARHARNIPRSDIELQVAKALEHRSGLGDAANLALTFDRDVQGVQLDAAMNGAITPNSARFDSRTGRFDVTLSIAGETGTSATRLRYTGTAVETVEAVVLARGIERNEVLKASDVIVERRPKAEVGADNTSRDLAVGMQARRQLRAGLALRSADLAKPDLVQRDQAVTLIYESAGLYLTIRGKATEAGTEGDVVNVVNLQSKRTVAGVVVGRGQVSVAAPTPRLIPTAAPAPVAESSHQRSQPKVAATATASPVTVAIAHDAASSSRTAE